MNSNPNVHVYTASREDKLLQLTFFLWSQLTPEQQKDLAPDVEAGGMGWAIPSWEHRDVNDWLTVEELASELGMTASGIRNWQSRYGLKPVKGRYRRGDVDDVMRRRAMRKHTGLAG